MIFAHRLEDGWLLFQPGIDRLVVLNATGKIVWDLLSEGYAPDEIAHAFARHFGLSDEQAMGDVGSVLSHLHEAGFHAQLPRETDTALQAPAEMTDAPAADPGTLAECGTFRFGNSVVRVTSDVAGVDGSYFARFRHRAVSGASNADLMEIWGSHDRHRLAFRGDVIGNANTLTELVARVNELLLRLEHPDGGFLAYFHAAAVSRGGSGLVLPGNSGVGKSTLTAYLVGTGFAYLGDDLIAMSETDCSLLPLPTCLALKAGSWPILEKLYPSLPHLPTVSCHGRVVRYVEPAHPNSSRDSAAAPSAIVFPAYSKDNPARLISLPPLQTMTRLIESHVDVHRPVTEEKISRLIRLVEETPAYELTYSNLRAAKDVIEDLLEKAG